MLISLNMLYTLKTNMKIYSTEIIISEMKIKNNVIIRWNYQDGYTKETKVCMLYVCKYICWLEEIGTFLCCRWECKKYYGKFFAGSPKIKKKLLYDPVITYLVCILPQFDSSNYKRYWHTYIHSRILHRQKVEETQVFTGE